MVLIIVENLRLVNAKEGEEMEKNHKELGLFGILAICVAVIGAYALVVHAVASKLEEAGVATGLSYVLALVVAAVFASAGMLLLDYWGNQEARKLREELRAEKD